MNENKNPQITLTKSSSISEILLENDSNAKEIFRNLKQNLYNEEHWNLIKDKEQCHFQLCNQNGVEKTGKIENGDVIRICVTDENQKMTCYDWFQIRDLEETNFPDEQIISFHLSPMMSSQLVNERKNRSKKRLAINSFSIRRLRNKIITEIEETNEMINLETVNFYHKIRNLFLGFNGILNIKTY